MTTAAIYLFGAIVYFLIGSAEVQPWAKETEHTNIENEPETPIELKNSNNNKHELRGYVNPVVDCENTININIKV